MSEYKGCDRPRVELINSKNRGYRASYYLNKIGRRMNELVWPAGGRPRKTGIALYRFLRDNIPLLNACIWTWSRLSAAPGHFEIAGDIPEKEQAAALACLEAMSDRIYPDRFQHRAGLESWLPFLFTTLYTDGAFTGFLLVKRDFSGIDRFVPIDSALIELKQDRPGREFLYLGGGGREIKIDGKDFYYFGLNSDINNRLGRSMLGSIPFVAHIEQQLINDMQKSMHNAGYHRLHVKITPPERLAGEADETYIGRINSYFDDTVRMIKNCETDDNPVTWDNIQVEYIGPNNSRSDGSSWSLSHRAMVEEICAGTSLSPFMLGFNYGTTHNWAQFKYDLVMRQIVSVQRQVARLLEWIGNIELALNGFEYRCRYRFDNRLTCLATESAAIEQGKVDNILKLYQAGLLSREIARRKAGELV